MIWVLCGRLRQKTPLENTQNLAWTMNIQQRDLEALFTPTFSPLVPFLTAHHVKFPHTTSHHCFFSCSLQKPFLILNLFNKFLHSPSTKSSQFKYYFDLYIFNFCLSGFLYYTFKIFNLNIPLFSRCSFLFLYF